jgi:hypothetical protein
MNFLSNREMNTMEFKQDRGTILTVTFQILYPNGQLKTVTMSLADTSEFKDVGMVVFDEGLLQKYVLNNLDKTGAQEVQAKWNTKDVMVEGGGEAPFKPALVLVDKADNAILKCGGHGSSGHIGTGSGVHIYM